MKHGENWRIAVPDRRFMYMMSEDPQNYVQQKYRELVLHYERLLEIDGVKPEFNPCASGMVANSQAIIQAIKAANLCGIAPAIYQHGGWYYENSIESMRLQDSATDKVEDANIFLLAIEPNGPRLETVLLLIRTGLQKL